MNLDIDMRFLVSLGQNQQPAAQQQHLDMARLDAGIAFDDRVDRVVALAEIARDEQLAAAYSRPKVLFRVVMTFFLFRLCWSSGTRIAQLLYKSTGTV
jgi:hypothetical protein